MSNKNRSTIQPSNNSSFKIISVLIFIVLLVIFAFQTATENYSNGERIGFITKFSHKGLYWKSWEGELNLTQTGMNTSSLFDFSIDNDNESYRVVSMIDSAVNNGWKVKLTYHEVSKKNLFRNRGETDYFVTDVEILDKNSIGNNNNHSDGRVIDTIFVVIDKNELLKRKIE